MAAPSIPRLLADLNPEQRRAVTAAGGPVLVLAGAGSGKTRVITCRIAHLLAQGVAARNVLAMTFTNKAAREMRERVAALVGAEKAKELTVGTFHAFCARALREHAKALDLPPRFGICDESDQLSAVKNALRELRVPEAAIHPRALLSRVSLLKNRLVSQPAFADSAEDDLDHLVARAWRRYDEILRRTRTLDFDDLLLFTVKLLADHADVRKRFQDRYRHVLVDEYQDTNLPQYEIVRPIAEKHRNLCVVGDDDQSIYGWRGADISKILNFARDFPGALVVRLETNYRSTSPILDAANAVIRHNRGRHEKSLRSATGAGPPVVVRAVEDEEMEADWVISQLRGETAVGRATFGDFAILFRTQVQPRPFEARLRAARIPYDLVGGMSFFDRKEVRDVLAYLKLVANPHDEMSLLRVINVPPRGVGDASVQKVLDFATKHGLPAAAAFDRGAEVSGVPPAALATVARFRGLLAGHGKRDAGPALPDMIRRLLEDVNYRAEIERCYDDPVAREARGAAVAEILNFAENHVRREAKPSLTGFLAELSLAEEDTEEADDEGKPRRAVTLMTLHAAKGLEFPQVFLVGAEEGLLPHQRSIEQDTVEEERRLMYVGITRARRHLTITYAKSRAKYGKRLACVKSRFVAEMEGEVAPPPAGSPSSEVQSPKSGVQGPKSKVPRSRPPSRRKQPVA